MFYVVLRCVKMQTNGRTYIHTYVRLVELQAFIFPWVSFRQAFSFPWVSFPQAFSFPCVSLRRCLWLFLFLACRKEIITEANKQRKNASGRKKRANKDRDQEPRNSITK